MGADPLERAGSRVAPAPVVERPPPPPRGATTAQAQSARRILLFAPLSLVALLVGTRWLASGLASRYAGELKERVAERTEAEVRWSNMKLGWTYRPCLEEFGLERAVRDLELKATAKQACVDRWASALGSAFRAVRIRLDAPSVSLSGKPGLLPGGVAATNGRSAAVANFEPGPNANVNQSLREYEVVFDNLKVDWADLPLPERLATGILGPLDGQVAIQRRGGKSGVALDVREATTGLSINGRATPTPDGWDLQSRIEGDLAPSFGTFLVAAGLDVRRLPIRGDIGAVYSKARGRLTIDLNVEEQNVDLQQEMVAASRLVGFNARQEARVVIDFGRPRLWINKGKLEVNGVMAEFSVDILGGENRTSPAFTFEFHLKTIPVAKLLGSLPGADTNELAQRIPPSVLFALDFALRGELKNPSTWDPEIEHRIIGTDQAAGSGLEYLSGAFDYYPLTKEGRTKNAIHTGPTTQGWLRYNQIPVVMRKAIQVSEDANFYRHHGLDVDGIRSAIVQGLTSEKKTRGGSTLTQQLVKNLFLTRERTAQRKIRELVLSFLFETALSKEQIFELYANVIEWGPGVYGLSGASQHYFGRSPQNLTVKEWCYLATIIPGPVLYHKHFEQGYVSGRHDAKVKGLVDRLFKLGIIDQAQYTTAMAQPIRFARKGKVKPVDDADRGAIDAAELAAESEPSPDDPNAKADADKPDKAEEAPAEVPPKPEN